jgi:oligopeptide transport system substrate-binding protein
VQLASKTLLWLALSVAACSPADDKSPYYGTTDRHGKDVHTFYVNNSSEPEYLDPGKSHDSSSSKLILHLFEGLAAYGPDSEPTLGVAVRYDKTKDSRFWRFHLRPDAKWNDGKIVTAHDFEYAFKRVIDPKTGSQSASNLYPLKNGELINQGKLKLTKAEVVVRAAARPDGAEVEKLPKGAAVQILGRSPVAITTTIAPFAEEPKGVEGLGYDKADASGAPEKLVILGDNSKDERGPDEQKRLPAGDYELVRRLGPVVCNGDADFFFEVAGAGGVRGVLPGCMLGASKSDKAMVLVAKHTDVPTFVASAQPAEEVPITPVGFIDESAAVTDTSIVGVRAVSDTVLEVELAYPTPYLLDLLCSPTAFPVRKDVIEKFADDPDRWQRLENIVTNGPYELSGWKFRYEIRMKRSEHHRFHDQLKIHEIVWMSVESYVSGMNLYKAGELDYSGDNGSLPPNYMPFLEPKKDFERTNYIGTYWYEYNTKSPPLDKVEVRRALNLAVDKKQLVEKVLLAGQEPASHFVPSFMGGGYEEAVKADKEKGIDPFSGPEAVFNPERARELLTQAGFPVVKDGDGWRAEGMPPVELLYNTSEGHKKVAVAIQDMWKRHLGVSVRLRNEEWKVMLKSVRDRNFQVVRFGWIGDYDHPQTFMDTFMSKSPNNRTGWKSAQFDALVAKARSTGDTAESMRLYREAEKILVDEVPKLPLYFYTKSGLIKPYVKGFHYNRRNEQLVHWMWIDENWRSNDNDEPAVKPEHFPPAGDY